MKNTAWGFLIPHAVLTTCTIDLIRRNSRGRALGTRYDGRAVRWSFQDGVLFPEVQSWAIFDVYYHSQSSRALALDFSC